jgi:hypothetical protein
MQHVYPWWERCRCTPPSGGRMSEMAAYYHMVLLKSSVLYVGNRVPFGKHTGWWSQCGGFWQASVTSYLQLDSQCEIAFCSVRWRRHRAGT